MSVISICVPFYREKNLKPVLSSLKGLLGDFELIIGDDSNGKNLESIITNSFPNVKYFKNLPKLGEVNNSNKCFSLATGEWICLYHDDDLLSSLFLKEISNCIERNNDIDVIYSGRAMVDKGGRILGHQSISGSQDLYIYESHMILDKLLLDKELSGYVVPLMTPGLVFKKNLLKIIGGFDKEVDTHCDTDFIYKLLSVSNKTAYVNKELYFSGIWLGSSGRTRSSEKGTVYWAQKNVINKFISFCRKQKIQRYYSLKNEILKEYAKRSLNINGPIIWIKLRYKGKTYDEMKIIYQVLLDIVKMNHGILLDLRFYGMLIVGLLTPKFLIRVLHKKFLSNYLTTT